jgi:hypothetical protein
VGLVGLVVTGLGITLVMALPAAQLGFFRSFEPTFPKPPYDGRFTFARLKFTTGEGRGGYGAWSHEYPEADENLVRILDAVTNLDARLDATAVVAIDDPDLFRYPITYTTEPGYWYLTDAEAVALRAYLQKGGFVIFDDFRGPREWEIFTANMRRVLPGAQFFDLTPADRVFNVFFAIPSIEDLPQYRDRGPLILRGVFEDNDPQRRMMVMVNFNTDVANYWKYAATGFKPIEESNEGYKLGVNYVIYGLTH